MSMISYAQNYEDVILWRALKNVKDGFYIDVGANDPIEDSVTKWFYDQGWMGINIEPEKKYYESLKSSMPNVVNLDFAIGERNEIVEFYETNTRGWSTTNKELAQRYAAAKEIVEIKKIQCHTLEYICENYALNKCIHFLKIDVEGAELNVLKGMNFSKYRPWILVIEATKPNSTELSLGWEYLVLDNDYKYVYFDGSNRFYVANEHYDTLQVFFQYPPNVMDDYISYGIVKRETEKTLLQNSLGEVTKELEHTQEELVKTKVELEKNQKELEKNQRIVEYLEKQMCQMKNSLSWKITKPFRYIKHKLR